MAEFLLEIFSEEIPARLQKQAMDDLRTLFTEGLAEEGLTFTSTQSFVTPRRLALVVDGLATHTAAREEERKGPRIDAPEAAIQGFLKSASIASTKECKQVETPKGTIWVYTSQVPPQETQHLLAKILWKTLQSFPWKRSQNWSGVAFKWIRPIRSIIALFDGNVLPYTLYLGDGTKGTPPAFLSNAQVTDKKFCVPLSNTTQGHRFMGQGAFAVTSFQDYAAKLKQAKVMLNREERKAIIKAGAEKAAASQGNKPKDDIGLVEEICGLVEWPVPLLGSIDKKFMDVPPEVLTTTMRSNQKYLAVVNSKGEMQPSFVVVANLEANDGGAAIIAGNEKVLRARFSDAEFFWNLDRAETLESRLPQLESIVFHAKLGTMAAKAARIEKLSAAILAALPKADASVAKVTEAARLCKADLVTGMVGEFPELQGIMGGYYARNDGKDADVARAIAEHYAPLGPNDKCPTAPVSRIVAMADKIDSLVGFFAVDEKPTGSKDPFALRRAALGVLRLLMENSLRLDLKAIFTAAYQNLAADKKLKLSPQADVVKDLSTFFVERLRVLLVDQGFRRDVVDAVYAADTLSDIVEQKNKLVALQDMLSTAEGQSLLKLYGRAANILKIEEKKDGQTYVAAQLKATLFELPQENALHDSVLKAAPQVEAALKAEDYKKAMLAVLSVSNVLAAFFDKVIVNADQQDVRRNRLALLSSVRSLFQSVANFAVLEEDR